MVLLGYVAAILIGISLGLIGGGGSILTIPVLVFLMNIKATDATTYSLFIVGSCSLIGSLRSFKEINYRTLLIFGSTSIFSVLITRKLLFPLIPTYLFSIGEISFNKDNLLMFLFGILMLAASKSMMQNRKVEDNAKESKIHFLLILGLFVGFITGILGAGGGFIIIPALVLFNKLKMKEAIVTSLSIITINSLIGFLGTYQSSKIDWHLLLIFTSIAIVGIFIGTSLSKKIPSTSLKKGFGWFVLLMGIFVIIREIVSLT